MVNFNGTIQHEARAALEQNRGFLFGDAVFETMKCIDGKILFFEEHYFRLMAAMRILRMEIPMSFTLEFLENQILNLVEHLEKAASHRVRITCFRQGKGLYLPETREVGYVITGAPLDTRLYKNNEGAFEVELFRDFYVSKQLLSTLKTTNKLVHICSSIFAEENGYDTCLLLNDDKNVVESTQGNLFLVSGKTIVTPPVDNGCVQGILRKQLLQLIEKDTDYTLEERSISPFELQKADELFITNVIRGIQSVEKYRKKSFETKVASHFLKKLNQQILLG